MQYNVRAAGCLNVILARIPFFGFFPVVAHVFGICVENKIGKEAGGVGSVENIEAVFSAFALGFSSGGTDLEVLGAGS